VDAHSSSFDSAVDLWEEVEVEVEVEVEGRKYRVGRRKIGFGVSEGNRKWK
jgi:hypothetical protein